MLPSFRPVVEVRVLFERRGLHSHMLFGVTRVQLLHVWRGGNSNTVIVDTCHMYVGLLICTGGTKSVSARSILSC